MNFIAIDFETANKKRSSPCEIGVVKVENSQIVSQKSYLIRPQDNQFNFRNVAVHGIDEQMVENAPEFDAIWEELKEDFTRYPLLAHYAAFDIYVLMDTLRLYGIEVPELNYSCTYRMAKKAIPGLLNYRLSSVCKHLDIALEHHRGEPDAVACAEIALHIFREKDISHWDEIQGTLFVRPRTNVIADLAQLLNAANFDPEHVFFEKTVVFTGKLDSMPRKDAQLMVMAIGGKCGKNLTKETDFLVLGQQDSSAFGEGYKSNKIKTAEKYLAEGVPIEVVTEEQFLEMV